MAGDDKLKALDAAIAKLEKDFGKGAVMKLGDAAANVSVETVPTGSLSLDIALGLGGVPKGRIIEIYGPESSGKTTVALHMIAEVQKRGGIAGFIDAEHALDPVYAKNIGVDIDELYISQPDSGDQALEITETMVRSGAMDIIVVDSVAALVPRQEIEGDMGDSHVGLQARLMSQALRKLTPVISKSNCVVIFINQLREKVGVMFGNPETTTGGRALKFYASIRMVSAGQSVAKYHHNSRSSVEAQAAATAAIRRRRACLRIMTFPSIVLTTSGSTSMISAQPPAFIHRLRCFQHDLRQWPGHPVSVSYVSVSYSWTKAWTSRAVVASGQAYACRMPRRFGRSRQMAMVPRGFADVSANESSSACLRPTSIKPTILNSVITTQRRKE